jgi:hypothetical protein
MKTYKKISLGIIVITFCTFIFQKKRKIENAKTTLNISNEGYEAAVDLLKPMFKNNLNKYHVGPVLPHHNFV